MKYDTNTCAPFIKSDKGECRVITQHKVFWILCIVLRQKVINGKTIFEDFEWSKVSKSSWYQILFSYVKPYIQLLLEPKHNVNHLKLARKYLETDFSVAHFTDMLIYLWWTRWMVCGLGCKRRVTFCATKESARCWRGYRSGIVANVDDWTLVCSRWSKND